MTAPQNTRDTSETARIQDLHSYQVLDTPEEFAFDDITEFASKVLGFAFVFINLIDKDRQWAKAASGLPREAAECHRDDSLCNVAINRNEALVIPDAQADERYTEIGCVREEPNVRFYAGMPLINSKGFALGTVCVVDFEVHTYKYIYKRIVYDCN